METNPDWNEEQTKLLIDKVRRSKILWQTSSRRNNYALRDEWDKVAKDMKIDKLEVQREWRRLLKKMKTEMELIRAFTNSDYEMEDASTWPYFKDMSFLRHAERDSENNNRPSSGNLSAAINFAKAKNSSNIQLEAPPENAVFTDKVEHLKNQETKEEKSFQEFLSSLVLHAATIPERSDMACQIELMQAVSKYKFVDDKDDCTIVHYIEKPNGNIEDCFEQKQDDAPVSRNLKGKQYPIASTTGLVDQQQLLGLAMHQSQYVSQPQVFHPVYPQDLNLPTISSAHSTVSLNHLLLPSHNPSLPGQTLTFHPNTTNFSQPIVQQQHFSTGVPASTLTNNVAYNEQITTNMNLLLQKLIAQQQTQQIDNVNSKSNQNTLFQQTTGQQEREQETSNATSNANPNSVLQQGARQEQAQTMDNNNASQLNHFMQHFQNILNAVDSPDHTIVPVTNQQPTAPVTTTQSTAPQDTSEINKDQDSENIFSDSLLETQSE